MESRYKINAYEKNQITLYTVQGEAESRKIIFDIVEKSGIVISTSNADVTDKMLDLTGYTVELYSIYNNQITASCRGTVEDEENGTVAFTLTADFMNIAGRLNCVIVLTKGTSNLRIVGITLDVQPVNAELAQINRVQIYRNTAWATAIQIENDEDFYILGSTESIIFTLKDGNTELIQKTLTSSDYDEDVKGYVLSLTSAETNIPAGTYYYNVILHRADNENEPIIPLNEFIITEG